MSSAPRLTRAGVLAALLSLVAVSCGSDLVDLLPPSAAGAGGGAAGGDDDGKAGSESAGTSSGGSNAEGGSNFHQGGIGGTGQSGGNVGGNAGGGCFGFACPGAGTSSGGSLGYPVQCAEKGQCKPGYNCDRLVGRCGQICTDTSDCENGRVCDTDQSVCVPCIDASACQNDFDPETRVCYLRRCVECVISNDCPQGERDVCNRDFECVECVSDQDCKANDNGREHCDMARGRCE